MSTAPIAMPRGRSAFVAGAPSGRRWLGVLAFFALTALSIPVHVIAVFFVFVEIASPGDRVTAALLIGGAFVASFLALLLTGVVSQRLGGFPGRWRARITFAALSAIVSIVVTYAVAAALFF